MYSYEICAGYSTMDASLHMKIPAILDCFQDAAILKQRTEKLQLLISMVDSLRGFSVHGRL